MTEGYQPVGAKPNAPPPGNEDQSSGDREFCELYAASINRRAQVEQVLWNVANGKRPLLSRDECRELATKLGVPAEWLERRSK